MTHYRFNLSVCITDAFLVTTCEVSILQLLHRNVKRFRGGLVFQAHRWLYHSTLGSRVIKKKRKTPYRFNLSVCFTDAFLVTTCEVSHKSMSLKYVYPPATRRVSTEDNRVNISLCFTDAFLVITFLVIRRPFPGGIRPHPPPQSVHAVLHQPSLLLH